MGSTWTTQVLYKIGMFEIYKLFWSVFWIMIKHCLLIFRVIRSFVIQELNGSSKIAIKTFVEKWLKFRWFKSVEEIEQQTATKIGISKSPCWLLSGQSRTYCWMSPQSRLYSLTNQGSYLSMGFRHHSLSWYRYESKQLFRGHYGSRGAKEVRRCKVSLSDQDKLHRFTAITPLPAQNSWRGRWGISCFYNNENPNISRCLRL